MTSFSVKVFTLIIRTLAKPMVQFVSHYKKVSLEKNDSRFNKMLKGTLTKIGQNVHYYNSKINNKLFKLSKDPDIKPLSEKQALEKGAEVFSEFIVYAILLTLPTLELIRQYKVSQAKEKKKEDHLQKMRDKIESIKGENQKLKSDLIAIKMTLKNISEKMEGNGNIVKL
jgi:hypothetical protein